MIIQFLFLDVLSSILYVVFFINNTYLFMGYLHYIHPVWNH
jgi:hypothetical protein